MDSPAGGEASRLDPTIAAGGRREGRRRPTKMKRKWEGGGLLGFNKWICWKNNPGSAHSGPALHPGFPALWSAPLHSSPPLVPPSSVSRSPVSFCDIAPSVCGRSDCRSVLSAPKTTSNATHAEKVKSWKNERHPTTPIAKGAQSRHMEHTGTATWSTA